MYLDTKQVSIVPGFPWKVNKNHVQNCCKVGFWEATILFSWGEWQLKVNYNRLKYVENDEKSNSNQSSYTPVNNKLNYV